MHDGHDVACFLLDFDVMRDQMASTFCAQYRRGLLRASSARIDPDTSVPHPTPEKAWENLLASSKYASLFKSLSSNPHLPVVSQFCYNSNFCQSPKNVSQ